ncbi:MAG TPA: energy-coupling factor ABC transporter permease [Bryobacteraceae bacterium]|nr:energy-coupling factor ABC transporter permease [Bryobacteraceae bacterium]
MHIPDGFLSTSVWATMSAATVPSVAYMVRRAQREVEEARVPLLGVMGAFVFAAQMINFPVGIGTTGHLIGSAVLAYTLGPAAASVVMTAILAIQALVFQDGGLLALGANVFNMAVAGVLAAYLPYHYWGAGRWRKAAIFSGAALSVLTGALLALAQLRFSGVAMPGAVVWVSLGLFTVNALLEGGITLAVMQSLEALNPGWLRKPAASGRTAMGVLLTAAVLLVGAGVLFAASDPDGIEKLAENLGIASHARTLLETPLGGYEIQYLSSGWLRKATAGLAGLALIYGACVVFGKLIARRRSA